jgi:hypothetical protein
MSTTTARAALLTPTPRVLEGENPFGVPPELDYLLEPQYDVPAYSETCWYVLWDTSQEVGLMLHCGRTRDAIDLWYAKTVVYLPGGELLVDRTFGRQVDRLGPSAGGFRVRCEEPHQRWSFEFDSAGEITTSEVAGQRVVGAGAYLPAQISLTFNGLGPVLDVGAALHGRPVEDAGTVWMASHHEQALLASGSIVVGDRHFDITDAVAFRDHSWGPRNIERFNSDVFFYVTFPQSKRVVTGLQIWDAEDAMCMSMFTIWEDGRLEILDEGVLPRATDIQGNPRELEFSLRRLNGEAIVLRGRALHCFPMTAAYPNMNINGVLADPSKAVTLNEQPITLTWPDGEVGYGHSERALTVSSPNEIVTW